MTWRRAVPQSAIRISSNRFLLPGAPAWRPLADLGVLHFGDYGDWPQALLSEDQTPLILLMFLQDLVPPDALFGADPADLDAALAPLLDLLAARLQKIQQPVILAWSAWRPASPIVDARAPTSWRRLTRRFSDALYDLAARAPALHLIALDDLLAEQGLSKAFDTRNFYAARCRLSRSGLAATAAATAAVLTRISRAAKKVLVLDCDNTLWGGVVGEVGLPGLTLGGDGLGAAFLDFQRAALRWARQGVLLALASKNNEDDVWAVFDGHPGMALKRTDILAHRIDWTEKSANLAAMADDLDLGLDSFVFWDDNPLEREKMRAALPQVTTIEAPADVAAWPDLLDGLDLFARFTVTDEDRRKNEQYRSRSAFVSEKRAVTDEGQFLRSIAMKPAALPIDDRSLSRAEQLCAKTNQFNLRTARHSAADLSALARSCGDGAFLGQLSDRFGDHGIVGLAIVRPFGTVAALDSFMLSCRVLGRRFERWMLAQAAEAARRQGCRRLLAQFLPTGRNVVAAQFLTSCGLPPLAPEIIPADDADLRAALAALGDGGELHLVDLDCFSLPDLDVFSC